MIQNEERAFFIARVLNLLWTIVFDLLRLGDFHGRTLQLLALFDEGRLPELAGLLFVTVRVVIDLDLGDDRVDVDVLLRKLLGRFFT